MSETFNLKWNNFGSNVSSSFETLRNEDYLNDVTLVTDDNQQISAHKLVLSACSDYFQKVFRNNQNKGLLLCLEGVTKEELNNCLDYMYNGEVEIPQVGIEKFFQIARRFKLNGLLNDDTKNVEDNESVKVKDETINGESFQDTVDENFVSSEVPTEPESASSKSTISDNAKQTVYKYGSKPELDKYIVKIDNGRMKCSICGKINDDMKKHLTNFRNHIETHMEGLSYPCSVCGRNFKTKNSLNSHKSQTHRK